MRKSEIACLCCFTHSNYFTTLYKKVLGIRQLKRGGRKDER